MKEEINGIEVELTKEGIVKSWLSDEETKIVDEYSPFGDRVRTQFDNILIYPESERIDNFKSKEYLKREMRDKNRAGYDIAKDFNTDSSTIRRHIKKHNIKRPLKDKELLEEMWKKNSMQEIAQKTNSKLYEVKIALEKKNIVNPLEE